MSDKWSWKFIEFDPRCAARGVEAAQMAVNGELFWFSLKDLETIMRDFVDHPELRKAIGAYKGKH